MRTLKIILLALVFLVTGVGEDFTLKGMLPPVSVNTVAAQMSPTGVAQGMTGFPETFALNWSGDLGTVASTAVSTIPAPCKGHFTQLVCTATLTGSCTTGPTVNVTDTTASTNGTAVSPTTTVATLASQAESLAFASGDSIGFAQTATVGTCTAPRYTCNAVAQCP